MRLSDFDFVLPEALIALRPARPRTAARLLVADTGHTLDRHVFDLPQILRPGDRLVLNDTKVIAARLLGERVRSGEAGDTRAAVEVTLLAHRPDGLWSALIKPLRKLRDGEVIGFADGFSARLIGRAAGQGLLQFDQTGADFDRCLAQAGQMPLPPYIAALRAPDLADQLDYQTLWAAKSGAVAAPTASLHFDADLMAVLTTRGVSHSFVTLHVGAGTFLPVKTDDISQHRMHAEWGEVTAQAAAEINATRAAGGRIIPVGTTALRLIETAAAAGGLQAWSGETDIFITPGFRFRIADGLMTNFHLPKSTLMMLVSALMGADLVGVDRIKAIYAHAIAENYRFFSYGDASLLLPDGIEPP